MPITSPSEAHKKRGGRLRTGHREASTGLPAAEEGLKAVQNASRRLRKPIRREEAGFGQATERPQQACQLPRSVEGGPKCRTSPSEAHKKRGGRLHTATCRGAFEGGQNA